MRYWPFYILIVVCGCINSPNAASPAEFERLPIVAGDVEISVGDGQEIIAPLGSATEGSKWIEHVVTYKNTSNRTIWIVGYAETLPFAGIETRPNKTAEWTNYSLGYCGTGAQEFEIAPDASYSFTAALPERYVGDEFRILLNYRTQRSAMQWIEAVSQSHQVSRSSAISAIE